MSLESRVIRSDEAGERFVAPTVAEVPPSGIRRFFDLASQMEEVISLGVGEPDFATPWHIRDAAIYSVERGYTTYTPNAGLPELREAVARYLTRERGVEFRGEQVLITVGVSEGIDLALRAVLRPRERVLIPEPSFVSYAPGTTFAGGTPVGIPLRAEQRFQLTEADLRAAAATGRTRAILLASPNNPTGSVLGRASLEAVARVAREQDLLVIVDEIYAELVYDGPFESLVALPGMKERTVLLGGFSKAFAMTGWRVGYAVAPPAVLAAMLKIHQYTVMCAPTPAQVAALEALRNGREERQRMLREYDRRRRLVVHRLEEMGLDCHLPGGAFYAFPSIASTGLSSEEFTERLLRQEKVAVVPGSAFGPSGEGYVRISYAAGLPQLEEALRRIRRFVTS